MPSIVEAGFRHASYYRDALRAANDMYLAGAAREAFLKFDNDRVNIEVGLAWAQDRASRDPGAAALCADFPRSGAYILSIRLPARSWLRWLDAGLLAAHIVGDRVVEAAHLGNMGVANRRLGRIVEAKGFFERQLDRATALELRQLESTALGNIGICHWELKEIDRSIECHRKALSIAREIGYERGQATALGNLGNAYADSGQTMDALEHYEQQLKIVREIGDRQQEANALGNIGLGLADLNRHAAAVPYYEQQLAITRDIGDRRGEGNALWSLSLALDAIGQRDSAVAAAKQAHGIFVAEEHPDAAEVQARLSEWCQAAPAH